MKKITKRTVICLLLAVFLIAGTGLFVYRFAVNGDEWVSFAANEHMYQNGILDSGAILDTNGVTLAQATDTGWQYHENTAVRKATLHAVGDAEGKIGAGTITAHAERLSGYNFLTGARTLFPGGRQIYLTLDAQLCAAAYQAMNGLNGCVGLYNYKTGEILCMVSAPGFDPDDPSEVNEADPAYEGVYLNRFLSASFIPGSTFKLITTAAALNEIPDIKQRHFLCTGSIEIGDDIITCTKEHGELNLQEALTASCNCVFGELAVELGSEVMYQYCDEAGLTTVYDVDGVKTYPSSFNFDTEDGYLAWSGVGQGFDLVNPCAMMVYTGAIANHGVAAVPHLISKVATEDNIRISLYRKEKTGQLLSAETADYINQMMRDNVTLGYGAEHFHGLTVGAKTGTAESDNADISNAWFTGFVQNEEHPYAFVVYLEGGGTGASAAMNVASTVLEKALYLGY